MKGLMNNAEAVKTLNNFMGLMVNRIHHIYNLGYTEGYKDGTEKVLQSIKEDLLGKFVTEGEDEIDDQA